MFAKERHVTLNRGLHSHPHSVSVHSGGQWKRPQRPSTDAGETQCGLYVPWMSFSPKKEGNPVSCYVMREPGGHYAQCNKPVPGHALCDPTSMRPQNSQVTGTQTGLVGAVGLREGYEEISLFCFITGDRYSVWVNGKFWRQVVAIVAEHYECT